MMIAMITRNARNSYLFMFISIAPFMWEQDLTAVPVQHLTQYIKKPSSSGRRFFDFYFLGTSQPMAMPTRKKVSQERP